MEIAGRCWSSGSGSSDSNIGGRKSEREGGMVGGVCNAQAPQLRQWFYGLDKRMGISYRGVLV